MRQKADLTRIRSFLRALGGEAALPTRVYLTGGATAVLFGWRESTVDVDLKIIPESDALLRAIPRLKEELELNVELACPADFIPEVPGWGDRRLFIAREGNIDFFHYDPYAQALAKVERGHRQDLDDVRAFVARGLVDPTQARSLFQAIKGALHRYPAIDPRSFEERVTAMFGKAV